MAPGLVTSLFKTKNQTQFLSCTGVCFLIRIRSAIFYQPCFGGRPTILYRGGCHAHPFCKEETDRKRKTPFCTTKWWARPHLGYSKGDIFISFHTAHNCSKMWPYINKKHDMRENSDQVKCMASILQKTAILQTCLFRVRTADRF